MPLTPLGMRRKSCTPRRFCVELKGAWSVATMPSTPPARADFSRRWCSGLRMGGLITYCAATCERNLSHSLCLAAYTLKGVYQCDGRVVGGDHARFADRGTLTLILPLRRCWCSRLYMRMLIVNCAAICAGSKILRGGPNCLIHVSLFALSVLNSRYSL